MKTQVWLEYIGMRPVLRCRSTHDGSQCEDIRGHNQDHWRYLTDRQSCLLWKNGAA